MSIDTHKASLWYREVIAKDDLKKAVVLAAGRLRDINFDTIVFTGVSGALFAPVLAYTMGKEIVVVRKPYHNRGYICEGYKESNRYLFVDDLIDSGATLTRVKEEMEDFTPDSRLVGVYLYDTQGSYTGFLPVEHDRLKIVLEERTE